MTSSKDDQDSKYKLKFMPEALEEWKALDGSVKGPLKKALEKRLAEPHVPASRLKAPLDGCYKIKLKAQGVRLVYKVIDEEVCVLVLAVGKREDLEAYTAAVRRIR